MFRKPTLMILALFGILSLIAMTSFFAGREVGAQGAADKVSASRVAFLDLDTVLTKDKTLEKDLEALSQEFREKSEALEKKFEDTIKRLDEEIKKYPVSSPQWVETRRNRLTKGSELHDELAQNKVDSSVERDLLITDAMARIDAAIELISKNMDIDTVIRIQTPDENAGEEKQAIFKYKAQRTLFFDGKHRDITQVVIDEINRGIEDKPDEE